jgi:hypothetical protein
MQLLATVAIMAATVGTPAEAKGHVGQAANPLAIVPIESVAGAGAAVRATVNGRPGLFLFDTGEGISTITPKFAHEIGCRAWGQVTGFRMSGERLDFQRCDHVRFGMAGQRFEAPIAGIFDVMSLLPESKTELAGSLGLDIFAGRRITIEPKSSRIVVESGQSFSKRIRSARRLPSRIVRDAEGVALAIDVAVPTSSGTAWMELDTGNGGTLVIGKHVAALLGLDPMSTSSQHASFQLAGGVPVAGEARVRDLVMDGNIGERFWSNWNLTLDLAKGGVWISPAAATFECIIRRDGRCATARRLRLPTGRASRPTASPASRFGISASSSLARPTGAGAK